ncbi:cobalt-precorrin-4/precorrin-4 C(11)-methyltransferase [Umezawaea beigongshangensis]|uniref:cobalt-precorrin-4/precorrin-4 C(11)-methyltransferase n=1 Tax=Umezawaea beigongshangensis TaxID=2780383 RepID=UPI0018F251D8|nr:cobalt-precorrin-4/precorrin-4 C(11)-methyltransferase [Umezawaea beigongshangensis]
MTTGRVSFVGAGPGAADLLTLRAARRIAEADVVLWAPGAVDQECVREHAAAGAELVDFSRVSADEVVEVYRRAAASRSRVVRLYSGDPTLWGGVQEQHDVCQRLGLEVEIVPGVPQFAAATAAIGRELSASVVVAGPEAADRIADLAGPGGAMAVHLSAARAGQLAERLRAGGYPEDTPVVVVVKVTTAEETVVHTTLGELENSVKEHKLYRAALFLVGAELRGGAGRPRFRRSEGEDAESARRAKPTRWSRRAGLARGAARTETAGEPGAEPEVPAAAEAVTATVTATVTADVPLGATPPAESGTAAAAWSAVHDWQETARRNRAKADAPAGDGEQAQKPRRVVAASKRTPSVQASTGGAKKPSGTGRTRKAKRTG